MTKTSVLICLSLFFVQIARAQAPELSYKNQEKILRADSILKSYNYELAVNEFSRLAREYKAKEEYEAYIYCLNQISRSYVEQYYFHFYRNLDHHTRIAKLSLAEAQKHLNSNHFELAHAYANLGYLHWKRQEPNQHIAENAFEKAIKIIESHIEFPEYDYYAYAGLADLYYRQEKSSLAVLYCKSVIKALESWEVVDTMQLGRAYYELGKSERGVGETIGSRLSYSKALQILQSLPENTEVRLLRNRIRTSFANTYVDAKNYKMAKRLYKDIIEDVGEEALVDYIRPLANIAVAYAEDRQFDLANKSIRKALDLEPVGNGRNVVRLGDNYIQYSYIHYLMGNADSVFYYARKTEDIYLKKYGEYATASCYEQYALGYQLKGEYDKALESIQKTIVLADPNFEDYDINSNPKIDSTRNFDRLYGFLSIKARFFYERFLKGKSVEDLLAAYKVYQTLDSLTDELRRGLYSQDTKLVINGVLKRESKYALKSIYELAKNTEQDRENLRLAYKFLEKNRYTDMFENLSAAQVLSDSLNEVEKEIAKEYDALRQEIAYLNDKSQFDSLNAELYKVYQKNRDLQNFLTENYPTYSSAKYGGIFPLDSIQSSLDSNSQFLEYLLSDTTVVILTITSENVNLEMVYIPKDLQKNLDSLLSLISRSLDLMIPLKNTYSVFNQSSYKLYKYLLDPVLDVSKTRLIISPDGILAKLPFEVLITEKENRDFKTASYLLKKYDVQYVYNLNLLHKSSKEFNSDPALLAFSFSDLATDSESTRSIMNELPSTAIELQAIQNTFSGRNEQFLNGDEATETAFKELASGFEIIHLAVHGVGDTEYAIDSRLEFNSSLDSINDGKLYAHELYNLDLKKLRLAVLSACETGIGKEVAGEGVFSIARGFAYAGAPSIVMSLWKVSDKHTARLIESFYKKLDGGESIDRALRSAKLSFLENADNVEAFPYHWSGFIAQGDVSAIKESKSWYLYSLYLIVPLVLLAGFYMVRRRG